MALATKKPPFHILLLPGGKTSLNHKDDSIDDYLAKRAAFWKKKAERSKGGGHESEYPVPDAADDETDNELQRMATPLELALIKCCELPTHDANSVNKPIHRSRLHRPIRPSNYDDPDTDEDENDESKPPDNPHSNSDIKREQMATHSGILRRGAEQHFLSLLCMHCTCSALGHRALALAILQRTVNWEAAKASPDQKLLDVQSSSDVSHNEERERRVLTFLQAGGMKLLAKWLVDSYTAVQVKSQPTFPKMGNKIVDSLGLSSPKGGHSVSHMVSPTGSLLLPILSLLKSIPFNKPMVVESGIHKCIKRLKKGLDTLVLRDLNAAKETHVIAGGLVVGIVLEAVDGLMDSWKHAAAAEVVDISSDNSSVGETARPFGNLRKELEKRFDNLATLQNEGGVPPEWLSKSVAGIISGRSHLLAAMKPIEASNKSEQNPSSTQPTSASESSKLWYPNTQRAPLQSSDAETRTWEKLIKKRQHPSHFLLNVSKRIKSESSKKVSWVDRPLVRSSMPAPLAEIRVFVNDEEQTDLASSESAGVVKDELVDDSELEDLCYDQDIADMF